MMRAAVLVVAACGASSAPAPQIADVEPAYGPLVGGTRIAITGRGFADPTGPTRVFVGGREAPVAYAVDDATLEVVIPPGDAPGATELLVFNGNGNAVAADRFRYSAAPAITGVAPGDVIYGQSTMLVVTGSGFRDEDAGEPTVLVDGVAPADPPIVVSDTELHVRAPGDRALGRPHLEIANLRGVAGKDRAFRYRPSAQAGLLLFPRGGPLFAVFYDPITQQRVDIMRVGTVYMQTIARDEHGEYWASESNRIGRVELGAQRLEQPATTGFRLPAMTRVGDTYYAIDRWSLRFGTATLDGTFTPIGTTQIPCCGSYGIAHDGTTLYVTYRAGIDKYITPIDPATGVLGTPVKLAGNPGLHVEELRAFAGKLYATSRDGTLVTVDPVTGATTVVASVPRSNAMEVFD